ncbi:MAG: hypothetical protein A2Y95_07440 [Deltaproteobacteria bacterium RBG_13_65_10]|nr:MAG: hypothetical protein A2Y95_07440 [Deltaproteobacteria bacterium RBG_13_65_10]
MSNVVLTGFMGTGKSAVGRALARRVGWKFVDTDNLIRLRARRSIPDIFERDGEAGFRALERAVIGRLAGRHGLVVATGGGAVTDRENVQRLRALGPIVWLRATPKTILDRVGSGDDRPLLAGARTPRARLHRIGALLARREAAYAAADVAVDTDAGDSERISLEVLRAIHGLGRRVKGRDA